MTTYTDKFASTAVTWDNLPLLFDDYEQLWDDIGTGTLYQDKF